MTLGFHSLRFCMFSFCLDNISPESCQQRIFPKIIRHSQNLPNSYHRNLKKKPIAQDIQIANRFGGVNLLKKIWPQENSLFCLTNKHTSLRRMDLYILPVGPGKRTKIPTWHPGAAGLMADRQVKHWGSNWDELRWWAQVGHNKVIYPQDHWTLKSGVILRTWTPCEIQVQTLPLEGPRSLG